MVKWSRGSGRGKTSGLRPPRPRHSPDVWPRPRLAPCVPCPAGLNQGKGHWSLGLYLALRSGLLALHPKEGGEEAAGLRDGEHGLRRKGDRGGQVGVLVLGRL